VAIIAAGRKIAPGALLGKLAVLGTSAAVALLLAELALRLLGLGHPYFSAAEAYLPSPNPRLLFTPRADFDGFSEGTWVHTNSLGLRERELPLDKPPGLTRLLFLGDSVTFGPGVRDDEPFPRLLEARLAGARPGRVETVNAGVVGYNTTQELARLQDVGLAYRPDVVVLTFVVNDLLDAFSIFEHQYEPTGPLATEKAWLRPNSHLYRFVQDTYWRASLDLRRLRTGQTEPMRPRARFEERLAEIAEIADTARSHGAAFFLVLYPDNLDDPVSPGPDGQQLSVRDELVRFVGRTGYLFLDLTGSLGDVHDPRARQYRLREDPHPSQAGHQVIADALGGPLRSVLASLPGG